MSDAEYTPTTDPMWYIRHAWATSTPGDYVQNAANFDRRMAIRDAARDAEVAKVERERIVGELRQKFGVTNRAADWIAREAGRA